MPVRVIAEEKDDAKYILEALLFAGCVDVSANWNEKDNKKILNLAKRIKIQIDEKSADEIKLSKIKLEKPPYDNDENAKLVKEILKRKKK